MERNVLRVAGRGSRKPGGLLRERRLYVTVNFTNSITLDGVLTYVSFNYNDHLNL